MLPSLSALRLAPQRRVHAPVGNGMQAPDSDDSEESSVEGEDEAFSEDDGPQEELQDQYETEKDYWPSATYALMASNPHAQSRSQYHELLEQRGTNDNAEKALSALRRVINGLHTAENPQYKDEMLEEDLESFASHYRSVNDASWSRFLEDCVLSMNNQEVTDALLQQFMECQQR